MAIFSNFEFLFLLFLTLKKVIVVTKHPLGWKGLRKNLSYSPLEVDSSDTPAKNKKKTKHCRVVNTDHAWRSLVWLRRVPHISFQMFEEKK